MAHFFDMKRRCQNSVEGDEEVGVFDVLLTDVLQMAK